MLILRLEDGYTKSGIDSFLLVQYFLACFMLSMRASLVYIIVFAANVFVLIKYGETLARLTESRMSRGAIFALYLAALAASVYLLLSIPVRKNICFHYNNAPRLFIPRLTPA